MGKGVLSVWAVFVGSVIGAGFASGAETVTFFAVYGTSGLVGALIAGAVLALLGARLMLIARNAGMRMCFAFCSAERLSLCVRCWASSG